MEIIYNIQIDKKIVGWKIYPVYANMEGYKFSGRYKALKWDGENMRVTNFEAANQFIKREYRKGWGELKL